MLRFAMLHLRRHLAWCRAFPWSAALFWAAYLLILLSGRRALETDRLLHSDYAAFHHAAEHLVRGEDIYQDCTPTHRKYVYYPFFAILLVALVPLGLKTGFAVWWVINALLTGWTVYLTRRLVASIPVADRWQNLATWLPLLACSGYFRVTQSQGNVNTAILALILSGMHLLLRGRNFFAGMVFGLATIAKVTPGLFLLYLAVKRDGRGVAGFLVGSALFGPGLGCLAFGPEGSVRIHVAETRRLLDAAAGDVWWWENVSPGDARTPSVPEPVRQASTTAERFPSDAFNQSLAAAVRRFTSPVEAGYRGAQRGHRRVHFTVWPEERIQTVVRWLSLGILVAVLIACLWPRGGETPETRQAEFGLLCLTFLMLSPVTWKQHMVSMIVPIAVGLAFLGTCRAGGGQTRLLAAAVIVSLALIFATRRANIEPWWSFATTLEAWSAHFFAMLVLWMALWTHRVTGPISAPPEGH
ncbi:MAG: DUF2029 domain-containing protein [Planctomycetes bacterium]|nr:DUF2029 domain-containing protein [Planctomycetota bacterium]